mgnify:CR=1 FL=1|jgi:DNA-directed RNA polymerase subunit RPC12/RpoP
MLISWCCPRCGENNEAENVDDPRVNECDFCGKRRPAHTPPMITVVRFDKKIELDDTRWTHLKEPMKLKFECKHC